MLAILTMAPLSIIGALSALPLALAHMQMSDPSPINDPHQSPQRPGETLDYNYLSPLNADGSNFACKGYHLNTPLNTVATYAAGSTQTLKLRGSATHGGGSCQISLSCDGGNSFNVLKSIIGGCPLSDRYSFTIPRDIPAAKKCLLAWTWFNRIGNREMYMNCAVVNITNKNKGKRDTQVSAANILARYPDLFVANLANINSCRVQETTDAIFDTPGKQVLYGNGDNASMRSSFGKGQCTGKPSKYAGSKAPASNNGGSNYNGGANSGQWTAQSNSGSGGSGQWNPPTQSTSKQSSSQTGNCEAKIRSGGYYPECLPGYSGNSRTVQRPAQPAQQQQEFQQPKQDTPKSGAPQPKQNSPNPEVQQELEAYLASLPPNRLARRNTVPVIEYSEEHEPGKEYSAHPHKHVHTKTCKHKASGYPPGSHYHNTEDLNLPYHKETSSARKRSSRQMRWTAYDKRQAATGKMNKYYRPGGDEDIYYQHQAAAQAQAQAQTQAQAQAQAAAQTSNDHYSKQQASTDDSAQASTQGSADISSDPPAQKSYWDMTDQERFEAFLRRMVELSTNMASLIKYASASTLNPSIPYYPPASTYGRTEAASAANARRGVLSSTGTSAQVYPGPAIGTISASGEATDAEEGFKAWFPNLVQGLVTKRQLVDPVTSQASAESGDGINLFDALFASIWKAFGDPFNIYGDDPETDPVPALDSSDANADSSGIPLLLGKPDFYSNDDFPDFDIPDLGGHYLSPPEIYSEPPAPELLPGYNLGPDGPVWVGEGPDPLADDTVSEPDLNLNDPESILTPSCTKPIPQIGFDSCLGGCNHSAAALAAHDVYLQEFAAQQAAYEQCLQNQTLNGVSPPAHILPNLDGDDDSAPTDAEDASHRRPRPGMSHPLIPYPLPANFTGPWPANSTEDGAPPLPIANTTTDQNDTASLELQPYANKTLGELVSEILKHPHVLGPVLVDDAPIDDTPADDNTLGDLPPVDNTPSNPDDALNDALDPTPTASENPLQQAADEAEDGIVVPTDPVSIDPNALESVADALPWFMGPGPVITNADGKPAGGLEGPL